MKTVVDYLKKHKHYKHNTMNHNFELTLENDYVILKCKERVWAFNISLGIDIEYEIQEALESKYKIEIRFCEECGIPFDAGYTVDDGSWHCCEDCFETAMNEAYGKDKWRGTEEEDGYGGYYEYLMANGEWEGTGIYYTEWN